MRFRPPSLGFLYLIAAIAAFGAFFVYITRPMWWDLTDARTSELAEAAYLERIATDGPPGQRARWLTAALRLAARHRDWELCDRVVTRALREQIELDEAVLVPIVPGACWAVGLDNERWTRGTKSAVVFLRNDGDAPRTARTIWTTKRSGDALVRTPGEPWQASPVRDRAELPIEHTIRPRTIIRLEVKASDAILAGRGANDRGLCLVRAEVTS